MIAQCALCCPHLCHEYILKALGRSFVCLSVVFFVLSQEKWISTRRAGKRVRSHPTFLNLLSRNYLLFDRKNFMRAWEEGLRFVALLALTHCLSVSGFCLRQRHASSSLFALSLRLMEHSMVSFASLLGVVLHLIFNP